MKILLEETDKGLKVNVKGKIKDLLYMLVRTMESDKDFEGLIKDAATMYDDWIDFKRKI